MDKPNAESDEIEQPLFKKKYFFSTKTKTPELVWWCPLRTLFFVVKNLDEKFPSYEIQQYHMREIKKLTC